MRRPYPLLPLALAAAALLPLSPASAQGTTPPQVMPSAVTPLPEMAPLAIPAPPGAKLRFEMDAQSEDLLGLVKSFLKGVGETKSTTSPTASAVLPKASAVEANPIEEALRNGNLADILKDVNHLHFAVWELPPPSAAPPQNAPAKPQTKTAAPIAVLPSSTLSLDTNAFYESAFQTEGAHRILYTDADAYKLIMVGFPNHHGFAFAASGLPATGGGYIAAARADGYPNMEALSAFISQITSAVLKTKTGKDMMDATLNSGKQTIPDDKGTDKK